MNAPVSFVTAVLNSDVLILVRVVLAPAIAWPEGSTTVPETVPVIVIWAESSPQDRVASSAASSRHCHTRRVLMFDTEFTSQCIVIVPSAAGNFGPTIYVSKIVQAEQPDVNR